jgi:hypothetical protein
MAYRDPTPEELQDPLFNRIWQTIKTWDINVPAEYNGYCGASGNHVCAILDAVREGDHEREQGKTEGHNQR